VSLPYGHPHTCIPLLHTPTATYLWLGGRQPSWTMQACRHACSCRRIYPSSVRHVEWPTSPARSIHSSHHQANTSRTHTACRFAPQCKRASSARAHTNRDAYSGHSNDATVRFSLPHTHERNTKLPCIQLHSHTTVLPSSHDTHVFLPCRDAAVPLVKPFDVIMREKREREKVRRQQTRSRF
jgi:hypothetical protein